MTLQKRKVNLHIYHGHMHGQKLKQDFQMHRTPIM